ncbi:2-polyprenyl-3-methyl-6-methoxy-1,4-benzoquinol hydroxylase [Streptomyces sp. NBRC 110611]|uniref:antibiotic biosynthesis monooxygenase n=1 Tax=Streptomyces sp. NBRC 110611 TaxID=1621259 RepID=UPI000858F176|nr:antibiotic biosynthesis monooxygenase [Streptomyces sp. NBRC 110611]GAU65170.1 2-polyprenyl-3-methyl-6-methoxy-1,4-benzoquinol hydroxylase [Streptomyces sp. NBRC 110611]
MTHFTELVHPDAGTALISEWRTGAPERSRAAADAMIGEFAAAETPSALLAQHLFLSTDGTSLLFYAQWTSDEDHLVWARAHRDARVSRIDTLVPGIERPGLNRTRLRRSVIHDAEGCPGVFGVATVAADDAEGTVLPTPGLLAAHVHLTTDGARAIVITEWTDAASHEAVAAATDDGPGSQRYTLHHSFLD